jgi:heme oxygenase (mycobilin-producing)
MALKELIKRHIKEGKTEEVLGLLHLFRSNALKQPGYISGETLVNHYDPRSITVVSMWQTIDDWIRWQESEERSSREAELEKLLEQPTKFEIYDLGLPTRD